MAYEYSQVSMPEQLFEPTIDHTPIASYGNATAPGQLERKWKYTCTDVKFDPDVHLQIEEPPYKLKMSDFGYEGEGISEIAAAAPFRLFTDEAIRLMRNDVFSEEVQSNCVFSSQRAPYMTRGYAPKYSKFIYDAWTHPRTLEALSKAAGLDLVPCLNYEIGHVNVQLGPKGADGVRDLNDTPTLPLAESEKIAPSQYDNRPMDDWHFDGVPFVAVLMLSDTTGMVGGETAVQKKDGTVGVIPSPSFGKVAVLQGSYVKHAALRAQNCAERLAMVTSLRPKDPFVEDMSHLRTVHQNSNIYEFGKQWLDYRLKVLEDRSRIMRERLAAADNYDKESVVKFVRDASSYMVKTATELYPDLDPSVFYA